jgi:hypothetical protein
MSDEGVSQTEGLSEETLALAQKGQEGLSAVAKPAAASADTKPTRPVSIPEKFWDAEKGEVRTEALLASYTELEKKLGGGKAEPDPDEKTPENDTARIKPSVATEEGSESGDGDEEGAEAQPAAVLTSAIEAAQQVYAETGELSEDTVKSLVDAGIPEHVVSFYLEGIKAQEKALAAAAYAAAGGEEQYKAAVAWAAKNWSAEEINAYDSAVGNPKLIGVTVAGLVASWKAAVGDEHGGVHQ